MCNRILVAGIVCVAIVCAGGVGEAVEVSLIVGDTAKVGRTGETVTTGVPFARGVVKDAGALSAKLEGKKIPAQFICTVPWDDGSVRWALMDTQIDVPPGGRVDLTVADDGAGPKPGATVTVDDSDDAIRVSTGPLSFEVNKKKFNLFESVKIDGKEMVTGAGEGLVVVTEDGKNARARAETKEVTVEQAGPMKAIVCVRGDFGDLHGGLLTYTMRVTAYAGKKYLKVHVWLENQGGYGYSEDTEWLNFDGMCVDLGLGLGGEITAGCEGASSKGSLKVEQLCRNHKYSGFGYTITSGDKELTKGDRTDGVVSLVGSDGKLTVAVRHFWQNYEKAIELADGKLKVWLWPTSGQWPRSEKRGASCGEFKQFRKPGLYALPGGVHKGYETILDFSGRDPNASAATVSAPLVATAAPAYYASTLAAPGWFAPADFTTGDAAYDAKLKVWNAMALNGVSEGEKGSLYSARRGAGESRGFWYGWMDFGDMPAQPGFCSLHYDWTWIMLLDYLRFGDRRFLDMGTEMARHRIDVDQIWSDRVNKAFRGLTRYEKAFTDVHGGMKGGYYKPIASHHWAAGVVLYYMLTGDEKARECALRSAMGCELRHVSRYDSPQAKGQPRESGWSSLLLCAVYDMTADKKYLDEAVLLWNNHLKVLWKEKGPTFGETGRSIQYLYAIYPMCMLHDRSGNEEILECLKGAAASGEDRDNHIEVNHLTNLYGYVGFLTKNEAYVKKAKECFATAIHKDKLTCYTGSGAWAKENAKKLRYGHLLQYLHWKAKEGE